MTLSNADVTEIHQLYAAYSLAVDDGDGKAFSSCFTEDGSVDTGGPPISGTDQLESFAEGVPASVPGIRHAVSNVHVVGDGDDAQGRAYVIAYSAAGGKASLVITGRYRDSFRRVDGTWLFAKRHFTPDI